MGAPPGPSRPRSTEGEGVGVAAGAVPEDVVDAVAVEVAGEGHVDAVDVDGSTGEGTAASTQVEHVGGPPRGVPEHVGPATAVQATGDRQVGAPDVDGGADLERRSHVPVPDLVGDPVGPVEEDVGPAVLVEVRHEGHQTGTVLGERAA